MAQAPAGIAPSGRAGSLYDTLELILDKGIVIDALVRVSLIGIELLRVEVRVVIASVDTYLRFATALNQMELAQRRERNALVGLVQETPAIIGTAAGALTDGRDRVPANDGQPVRQRVRATRG
jgi:hypothetical protein